MEPPLANMRSVFESISKMYYIVLFPKEIENILVNEKLRNVKFDKVKEELDRMDLEYKKKYKYLTLNQNKYRDFQKKYTASQIRKNLYGDQLPTIQKNWDFLCHKSHANITEYPYHIALNQKNDIVYFEFLACLLFYNITANLETSYDLEYFNLISEELYSIANPKFMRFHLIPDKTFLAKKLKFVW